MRCRLPALLVTLGLAAAGCTSAETGFDLRTANFAVTDTDILCAVYSTDDPRAAEAGRELERRGVFTSEDWQRVKRRELYKGQSECGLLAAFGLAEKRFVFEDANTGRVLQRQFFYSCKSAKVPDCPYTDIVMQDGRVVSWSAAASAGLSAAPAGD